MSGNITSIRNANDWEKKYKDRSTVKKLCTAPVITEQLKSNVALA